MTFIQYSYSQSAKHELLTSFNKLITLLLWFTHTENWMNFVYNALVLCTLVLLCGEWKFKIQKEKSCSDLCIYRFCYKIPLPQKVSCLIHVSYYWYSDQCVNLVKVSVLHFCCINVCLSITSCCRGLSNKLILVSL